MFSAIYLVIKIEGAEYWGYFHACALAVQPLDSTQLFLHFCNSLEKFSC